MPYLPERSAIVLIPQQPMLLWVQQVHDEDLDMETLFGEAEAYLTPSFETDEEMEAVLRKLWPQLFEIELKAWNRDPETWPTERSFDLFNEWFQFTPFNGVHDLGTGPIKVVED